MNGVMLAVVARKRYASFKLGDFHARRAEERPVKRVEALEFWTCGWPVWLLRTVRSVRLSQLSVQLDVPCLEYTCQWAMLERLTHGLHFRETCCFA